MTIANMYILYVLLLTILESDERDVTAKHRRDIVSFYKLAEKLLVRFA